MTKIELPRYSRFFSEQEGRFVTNDYSGSLGTHPERGCVSELTFHFRIHIDTSCNVKEDFRITAEAYLRQPWALGAEVTESTHAEFENSERGLEEAALWLSTVADKHGF